MGRAIGVVAIALEREAPTMRFGRERSVFESSFVGEHFAGIETRVFEEEFASQVFQIPFWCNLCEMLVRLR